VGNSNHLFQPPDQGGVIVTQLTDAAVQAAISAGGRIFVSGSGTLTHAATWTFPDKHVTIEFDPRITVALGSSAIAAFTVPAAALTVRRLYKVIGLVMTGGNVAAQSALKILDAGGLATVHFVNYLFAGFRIVPDIQAGDTAYLESHSVIFQDGYNVPPSGAANPGFSSSAVANTYTYPAEVKLIRSNWSDHANAGRGYIFNVDYDIHLINSNISVVDGTCKLDGLFTSHDSAIEGKTSTTLNIMECYGASVGTGSANLSASRVSGLTLTRLELQFLDSRYQLDGITLEEDGAIALRANGINAFNISNPDPTHTHPPRFIEITGDDCLVSGCRFRMSNTGVVDAVRNYGLRTRAVGNSFTTSGGTPGTWHDLAPGDYTLGDGNVGIAVGGGTTLGANSKMTAGGALATGPGMSNLA
jgi:hypothetical protein